MKKTLALILALCMIFALCACGQSAQTAAPAADAAPTAADAAPTAADAAPTAGGEKKQITLGTATTGGFTYIYGAAVAEIINKYCNDINVTATITTGGTENMYNIMGGEIEMGIAGVNIVSNFYEGNAEEGIDPQPYMRTLWASKSTCASVIVPKDSSYQTLDELKGKKISIGNQGGSAYEAILLILKALGYSESDFDLQYLTMNESKDAMIMGNLDAFFTCTTDPHSAMTELFSSGDYRFLDWSDEQLDLIKAGIPYMAKSVRPAGTYKGQDKDLVSLGSPYIIVVTEDFPEDIAYEIAKCLDEHYDELVGIASSCEGSTLEHTVESVYIPLHAGVEKYAKEKGLVK